jgi:hypothetical protein
MRRANEDLIWSLGRNKRNENIMDITYGKSGIGNIKMCLENGKGVICIDLSQDGDKQ